MSTSNIARGATGVRRYLLATASVVAASLASTAYAQTDTAEAESVDEVVVTGSRVVTNGMASPTPVTVVSTDRLLAATPSNVPDALATLPQFSGTVPQRGGGAPATAKASTLNLRNFGPERNLVLMNGLRVGGTTAGGIVDLNTLPQMLIRNVDIVTGGASAVYGSDAVTGVINFVIDKRFNGVKTVAQYGVSSRSDNESWKVGIAAGTDLFADNRGHIEFSYEHYDSNGVPRYDARPVGEHYWTAVGAGTAANPFALIRDGRSASASAGGLIIAGPAALVGQNFTFNGILQPFVHGQRTGTAGTEDGGDGALFNSNALFTPLETDQVFGRFDYEVSETISAYVEGSYSRAATNYTFAPFWTIGMPGGGATILNGNAFLPASAQAVLAAAGPTSSFRISKWNDVDAGIPAHGIDSVTTNETFTVGLEGKLFENATWTLGVRHSRSEQDAVGYNNQNIQRSAAALDAVINPANGQVVCQVSLTQFASLYPGCVPLNIFGPTATSRLAADYVTDDTTFNLVNKMTLVAGSITATPFSLPAGEVRVSVSAEYRKLTLDNDSSVEPTALSNCTGLRANCNASTPLYSGYLSASVSAEQNVKEAAAEVLVPLVKDIPLVKLLELNAAGRYTDYSTSGGVETWKVGFSWEVTDELRLRGTRSRDIRAPSLNDLFRGRTANQQAFTDLHTGIAGVVTGASQGNPDLVPEVAKTLTLGLIYTPQWLPGFSASVDYYDIELDKAISNVGGQNQAIQRLCEDSNGASPYCQLYVRPLPFSDHSPANYPTQVLSQSLNVAKLDTYGVDVEVNYEFDLANLFDEAPGRVSARLLGSYQPHLRTQSFQGAALIESAGVSDLSKYRVNASISYRVDDWSVTVIDRWKSGNDVYAEPIAYTIPDIDDYNYVDVSLDYRLKFMGGEVTAFANVQNLFDKGPPIVGGAASAPGLTFWVPASYDIVGRYYTIGLRTRF